MKYITLAEHEMSRIKGPIAVFGAAVLIVVVAACGNGTEPPSLGDQARTPAPPMVGGTTPTAPIVSHGGPVKDYTSLVDNLRAAGAAIDPAGSVSQPFFAPQGQVFTVNGERVETFEFASAEEADAAAGGVSATGSSIVTTMADGTQMASMITWVAPAHFYKAGKLIVIYVGSDSDVIDALQDAMGPQFAGGESLPPAPGIQPAPAISSGILRLTFDGVEYAAVEWLGAASPNGPVVCCGTPINMDDMEVVGTGTRNTDADTSVEVYRPKADATTDVYIFHPATTVEKREPGGLPPSPARPAQWVRWTDDIAPPAPAALPAPLRLTFEGVEYTGVQILGALSPTGVCVEYNPLRAETAIVTPCLTPINMDDMEVVGTGTDHNPDGDASVEVYRPKAGATTDVYTKELGGTDTGPATWFRWTAKIS